MPEARSRLRWESLADVFGVFTLHAALYRLLRGRLVGRNTLVLTTIGRKSGRRRSVPLFFVRDGADWVVVASNGGSERHPGWFHNLRAAADVMIQVGSEVVCCRAEVAAPDDGARLWPRLDAVYAGYGATERRPLASSRSSVCARRRPARRGSRPAPQPPSADGCGSPEVSRCCSGPGTRSSAR